MTMPGPGPSDGVPDETLALAVVITGVLVLSGSTALQVVWLVAIGLASAAGFVRRSAVAEAQDRGETPT